MAKKILILLDKINSSNCGLQTVSESFIKNLNEYIIDKDIEFHYLINGNTNLKFLNTNFTYKLKNFNRIFPANIGKFDILHILHQNPAFKVKGCNKKILTIHDLNFIFTKSEEKKKKYLKKIQNNVDMADAIVFVSNFTRAICYEYLNISPEKITKVIYNGVEFTDLNPQKPSFIGEKDEFLFTIGQFLPYKNYHVLLPFIKLLPSNIKLIISGNYNTSYGHYLRNEILKNSLQNRVILSGMVTETEKKYLYQHCKALLFPSTAEGFGLPIVEAMRARKPVFCSDKTSLKEIGNKHVFFWQTFDPNYMKNVFESGLAQFDNTRMEEAYQYSLQFTWGKNAIEYYKLYTELTNAN
jgi:glycosyltransferase involved in cell wall biosynthesis